MADILCTGTSSSLTRYGNHVSLPVISEETLGEVWVAGIDDTEVRIYI